MTSTTTGNTDDSQTNYALADVLIKLGIKRVVNFVSTLLMLKIKVNCIKLNHFQIEHYNKKMTMSFISENNLLF